jgi:hypothetical protein
MFETFNVQGLYIGVQVGLRFTRSVNQMGME